MTLDEYIEDHIDSEGEYLHKLYRATQTKLLYGHMASGHVQGRLLKMLVEMIRPTNIIEIGTFSGYSALCMAEALPEKGVIHTIEFHVWIMFLKILYASLESREYPSALFTTN